MDSAMQTDLGTACRCTQSSSASLLSTERLRRSSACAFLTGSRTTRSSAPSSSPRCASIYFLCWLGFSCVLIKSFSTGRRHVNRPSRGDVPYPDFLPLRVSSSRGAAARSNPPCQAEERRGFQRLLLLLGLAGYNGDVLLDQASEVPGRPSEGADPASFHPSSSSLNAQLRFLGICLQGHHSARGYSKDARPCLSDH